MKTYHAFTVVCSILAFGLLGSGFASAASITEIKAAGDGQYDVTIAGKLFASLHTKGHAKPIIYPIIGPNDAQMTRHYPMKKGVAGEASDHPHHQSLWYTHGDVNGTDFWAVGKGKGKIVTTKVSDLGNHGTNAKVTLHNNWQTADGKTLLTDVQKLTFHKLGNGERAIDYEITMTAAVDVTFGDTKEGTMGIRTNPALRTDKGAKTINSEGVTGKSVWGKKASWVDYSNAINGKTIGVAIFDHPTNPRHPTTWHARAYGLVAANPYGLSYFQKMKKGAGDLKLKKGDSVTYKYRFLFHNGDDKAGNVAAQYAEFAGIKPKK